MRVSTVSDKGSRLFPSRPALHAATFLGAPLLLSACAMPAAGPAQAATEACPTGAIEELSPQGLPQSALCIESARGKHAFTVEVAATPPQQARGLMFRTELADDKGMIFLFEPARDTSFWMRNTVIPLDMIFIRADGTIARIAANTTPYSLDPVESGEPVAAVLEVRGGLSAERGIAPGDKVRWR